MGPSDEECGGFEARPPFCQASSGTFWGCLSASDLEAAGLWTEPRVPS